jgi:hypothetical protein
MGAGAARTAPAGSRAARAEEYFMMGSWGVDEVIELLGKSCTDRGVPDLVICLNRRQTNESKARVRKLLYIHTRYGRSLKT